MRLLVNNAISVHMPSTWPSNHTWYDPTFIAPVLSTLFLFACDSAQTPNETQSQLANNTLRLSQATTDHLGAAFIKYVARRCASTPDNHAFEICAFAVLDDIESKSNSECNECPADNNEPNDSVQAATDLGSLGDNASSMINSVMTDSDLDWYQFSGFDSPFGRVAPAASLDISGIQLCMYASCMNGLQQTTIACVNGANSVSDNGLPGCCSSDGSAGVNLDLDCGHSADDALVVMRVGPGNACLPYELTYQY